MKKIGIIFITAFLLAGCTSENGIVNDSDAKSLSYKAVLPLIEEQNDIAYRPEEVQDFFKRLEELRNNLSFSYEALDYINFSEVDRRYEINPFIYSISLGEYNTDDEKEAFYEVVNLLDETIGKGVKNFLETHKGKDGAISRKFDRIWVDVNNRRLVNYGETRDLDTSESISLFIKVNDLKNPKYQSLVDSVALESLMLEDVIIGKNQNVIELANTSLKVDGRYSLDRVSLGYQLFLKEEKLIKTRISVVKPEGVSVSMSDLEGLNKVADEMGLVEKDIEVLDKIKNDAIKNNKKNYFAQTKSFNFEYRNSSNNNYQGRNNSVMEIVIEKR